MATRLPADVHSSDIMVNIFLFSVGLVTGGGETGLTVPDFWSGVLVFLIFDSNFAAGVDAFFGRGNNFQSTSCVRVYINPKPKHLLEHSTACKRNMVQIPLNGWRARVLDGLCGHARVLVGLFGRARALTGIASKVCESRIPRNPWKGTLGCLCCCWFLLKESTHTKDTTAPRTI